MSRVRKANETAIEKTLAFLNNVKILNSENKDYKASSLQQSWGINKSTYSACVKLKFIKDKKLLIDADRVHALQILEVLRQTASKRIDVALSDDFTTAIERLTTSMNTLSIQNEKSLKSPLLSRALNQSEQRQGNTLFGEVESNEAKRFELLKAVASSWQRDDVMSVEWNSLQIIEATEDLFNKFFSKK